jgi:cation transport ATPase
MVEDRMSDAPSLSGADLGISAHVAIEAADVALASSDMPEVANVIDQSRRSPCARRP